jgi:regulator of protease activity HflC (stomatin/prohibitin superfamily)
MVNARQPANFLVRTSFNVIGTTILQRWVGKHGASAMFDGLSVPESLLLISVALAAFIAGRLSARQSPEALERKRITEAEAARNFTRLSTTTRAEVDRLLAEGKTIEAIKLMRAELNTGLYEAKQIADQRKRAASLG